MHKNGKHSGNFDLTRAMPTSYRTEVVLGAAGKFEWSTEYWIGFSFRLEQWDADRDVEIAPFQIHPTPLRWDLDPKCSLGSQIGHGPVMDREVKP